MERRNGGGNVLAYEFQGFGTIDLAFGFKPRKENFVFK
jgi:hypothetical protein